MEPSEASEALGAVREGRIKAADMPRIGWGYHFCFGAMMGGLVLQQSMPLGLPRVAILVATILLGAILYRWKRNVTGRWINAYRAGRTRLVVLGLPAIILLLVALTPPIGTVLQPWQAALLALVMSMLGGRLWLAVYDADLRQPA